MDAAHEGTQFGQRRARRLTSLRKQLANCLGVGIEEIFCQVQSHAHRHQSSLRTVVQIPLDAANLGSTGIDRLRACLGQVLDPLRQLSVLSRTKDGTGQAAISLQCKRRQPHGQGDRSSARYPEHHSCRDRGVEHPHKSVADAADQSRRCQGERRHRQHRSDQSVRRHPAKVLPGGRVRQDPATPLRARTFGAVAGRWQVGLRDRQSQPVARQPPGELRQTSGPREREQDAVAEQE